MERIRKSADEIRLDSAGLLVKVKDGENEDKREEAAHRGDIGSGVTSTSSMQSLNLNHETSYDGDNRNQLFSKSEMVGDDANHAELDDTRDSIKSAAKTEADQAYERGGSIFNARPLLINTIARFACPSSSRYLHAPHPLSSSD